MSTEMTITRAIATQKALTERIAKLTNDYTQIVVTRGLGNYRDLEGFNGTVAEAEALITSGWTRLNDIIAVRNEIRSKLLVSNATTKVVIGDKEMTVVEALDYRKALGERKALLTRLKSVSNSAQNNLCVAMDRYNKNLDRIRSEAIASGKKVDENFVAMFITPVENSTKPTLLDPLNSDKLVADLQQEMDDFVLNVDYALSESNARTTITIEDRGVLSAK